VTMVQTSDLERRGLGGGKKGSGVRAAGRILGVDFKVWNAHLAARQNSGNHRKQSGETQRGVSAGVVYSNYARGLMAYRGCGGSSGVPERIVKGQNDF